MLARLMLIRSSWVLGAAVALGIACSSSSNGGGGGSGGGGSAGGGANGNSGGSGGSSSKGGSGGSGTGGSAQGGAGGSAEGGSGTGGAATGGMDAMGGTPAGTGGIMFVQKHPTWDFETASEGWAGGVDHLNAESFCKGVHNRVDLGMPMTTAEEKKSGEKSLMYDVDLAAAVAAYNMLECKRCKEVMGDGGLVRPTTCEDADKETFPIPAATEAAIFITNERFGTAMAIATLSQGPQKAGLLPVGTKITLNYKFPPEWIGQFVVHAPGRCMPPSQGGGCWQSMNVQGTGDWAAVTLTLTSAVQTSAFGFFEFGVFSNLSFLPANFKGKLYIDAVDVVFPE